MLLTVGNCWTTKDAVRNVLSQYVLDVSFVLTIKVFYLRCVFVPCGGGTASRKDQTQFPDGVNSKQKRPNPISGRGKL